MSDQTQPKRSTLLKGVPTRSLKAKLKKNHTTEREQNPQLDWSNRYERINRNSSTGTSPARRAEKIDGYVTPGVLWGTTCGSREGTGGLTGP